MNRQALEHIIRAAGEIAQVRKLIVFGSQSILAQFPDLTRVISESKPGDISETTENCEILVRSIEADIMIPNSMEKTELVDAVLGELSNFHGTFGYYAQGVDLTTSRLPEGWENRLVEICNKNTNGVSGMCVEIHDVMISKLYASRPKDLDFFKAAVKLGLVSKKILLERLSKTKISADRRSKMVAQITRGTKK